MSEFTKLTTQLVTPILKRRGFKKHGAFDGSPSHDSAVYRNGDTEVCLTYAFHPYDYPDVGIRLCVRRSGTTLVDSLHPPAPGGTEAMLRAVISKIETLIPEAAPV
jgi:hypothetical protein